MTSSNCSSSVRIQKNVLIWSRRSAGGTISSNWNGRSVFDDMLEMQEQAQAHKARNSAISARQMKLLTAQFTQVLRVDHLGKERVIRIFQPRGSASDKAVDLANHMRLIEKCCTQLSLELGRQGGE